MLLGESIYYDIFIFANIYNLINENYYIFQSQNVYSNMRRLQTQFDTSSMCIHGIRLDKQYLAARSDLASLVQHLDSHPAHVSIGGVANCGMGTFVTLVNIILTYLAIVYQSQPTV